MFGHHKKNSVILCSMRIFSQKVHRNHHQEYHDIRLIIHLVKNISTYLKNYLSIVKIEGINKLQSISGSYYSVN